MSRKLLIVDDEDTIRNGIAKYIKLHTDRFDKVYTACNGEEALEIIFRDKPDIMILDMQMPLKDGIEVMRDASRVGMLPYTLVLSGYEEFRYCQQALHLGAKDYLLKPVRSSDILRMVQEASDKIFGVEMPVREESVCEKNQLATIAREYLQEHYFEKISLSDVADRIGVTPGYLSTLLQKQYEKGFVDLLNEVRIERACTYLQQNYLKTYEIAFKVGFNDEKYFSKVFKKIKGCPPSEYKKTNQV